LLENVNIIINAGSAYSEYTSYEIPTFKIDKTVTRNWELDTTSSDAIIELGTVVTEGSQEEYTLQYKDTFI